MAANTSHICAVLTDNAKLGRKEKYSSQSLGGDVTGAEYQSSTMIDSSSADGHLRYSHVSQRRDLHQGSHPAGGVMQTKEGTVTFKCEGCGVRKPEAERY